MRASVWTHPKTSEKRVYLNDLASANGAKVFLRAGGARFADPDFADYVIQASYPVDRATIEQEISRLIGERFSGLGFSEIVASLESEVR